MRRNLERSLLAYLTSAQELVQGLALVFSRGYDASHNPLLQQLGNPAGQDMQALAEYLRAEGELGRIRPLDAEVTALAMIGALSQFISQQVLLGQCQTPPATLDPGRFVRGLLDLWWPGLAP